MRLPVRCRLLLATAGAAVALTAGCGAEAAAPASSGPFPPRPTSIDVSRLDPCSGVTPAEAERLQLPEPLRRTADVGGAPSPTCSWDGLSEGRYSYAAQFIPVSAAEAAQDRGSELDVIDGYGAVRGSPASIHNVENGPAGCQFAVDVADGYTLRIQVSSGALRTGNDPKEFRKVCAEARRFASAYLVTVRG
ncbi:DUF3558 family protein [Pseudonocardia phyllosphaerae]|uniref:DUF3558 family protein n=1 Tax=Pseudonocardia phyllosphaerae TaxID=3390502 RepID=UPI00397DE987